MGKLAHIQWHHIYTQQVFSIEDGKSLCNKDKGKEVRTVPCATLFWVSKDVGDFFSNTV